MPLSLPAYTRTDRLFEWIMALTMILIALTLALPGDSLERSALRWLLMAGFTESGLATTFSAVGVLRGCALFANGAIPVYGPWARHLGAFVGFVVWLVLAACLTIDSVDTAKAALTAPVFYMMAAGEAASGVRAIRDARRRHRHHSEQP